MISLESLIAIVEAAGFCVAWTQLHRSKAGYHHPTKTIWMDYGLDSRPNHAISTLAHEFIHAQRGDDGPQPRWVESLCDEEAARFLISPAEYALAESIYGPHPAQIATELGVTQTIVEAYQRTIRIAA